MGADSHVAPLAQGPITACLPRALDDLVKPKLKPVLPQPGLLQSPVGAT